MPYYQLTVPSPNGVGQKTEEYYATNYSVTAHGTLFLYQPRGAVVVFPPGAWVRFMVPERDVNVD